MKFNKVLVEIVAIEGKGRCSFGHKVGEKFVFDEFGPNRKMCLYALAALLPAVNVLLHQGRFPWLPEGEELYWGCPHPGTKYPGLGQVIFKLSGVKKSKGMSAEDKTIYA